MREDVSAARLWFAIRGSAERLLVEAAEGMGVAPGPGPGPTTAEERRHLAGFCG